VARLARAIAPYGTGACRPLVESIEQTLRQQTRRFTGRASVARTGSSTRELTAVRVAFGDESDRRLSFLYGDSVPSSLQTNFLAFLGDALDLWAQVLEFDAAVTQAREDVERLPREALGEIVRLDGLVELATAAFARASLGGDGSPSARVAASVLDQLATAVE